MSGSSADEGGRGGGRKAKARLAPPRDGACPHLASDAASIAVAEAPQSIERDDVAVSQGNQDGRRIVPPGERPSAGVAAKKGRERPRLSIANVAPDPSGGVALRCQCPHLSGNGVTIPSGLMVPFLSDGAVGVIRPEQCFPGVTFQHKREQRCASKSRELRIHRRTGPDVSPLRNRLCTSAPARQGCARYARRFAALTRRTRRQCDRQIPERLSNARYSERSATMGSISGIESSSNESISAGTTCGTRACRLLADGVDIRIIQLMLGHASIQQTQRCLNVTDEELRRGLALLEVSWKNESRPLRLASGS